MRIGTQVYAARVEPVAGPGELAAARAAFRARDVAVPDARATIGRIVGETPVGAPAVAPSLRSTRQ